MRKKLNFPTIFILSLFFVACDKDNDNSNESDNLKNKISAKWEIADINSPYASFEFNKDGNYIIVRNNAFKSSKANSLKSKKSIFKNDLTLTGKRSSTSETNLPPVLIGTYKIEENTIILSGFGLIEDVDITNEKFSFSLTPNATGEKNSFIAERAEDEISSSDKTNIFCRTWTAKKASIDVGSLLEEDIIYYKEEYGNNWESELLQELNEDLKGFNVFFSKAGTYLTFYNGEEDYVEAGKWKWANKEETKIYYSWENWTENWRNNTITIDDLKSTSLSMRENGIIVHFVLNR